MSPLENAILGVSRTGWLLQGLSKSPFDSVKPWMCCLVPGHLGGLYHWGEKVKVGLYSVYPHAQARVTSDGATPLEAIQNALAALDKSPAKKVYSELERAFAGAVNERKSRA